MKKVCSLFILIFLPFLFSNNLFSQIAHKYLFNKGYKFPVESTLSEIDSIEKVRMSYKGTNDSLFLEITIYKFERLAFLPDSPIIEFDYLKFYEEIINLDISSFYLINNINRHDPFNDLHITSLLVKTETCNRLFHHYNNNEKFEQAIRFLDLRFKCSTALYGYRCIQDTQPHISDEIAFNCYIGLNDIDKFLNVYIHSFWEYFFDSNSIYFQNRTLPFIEFSKKHYSKKQRLEAIKKAENSIDCGKFGTWCKMMFLEKEFFIYSEWNYIEKKFSKQEKEQYLKSFFQQTKFYELFKE